MTTLGERLKAQNDERKRQDVAKQNAKTIAIQREVEEKINTINVWVETTKNYIIERIEADLPIKSIRVPDVPKNEYKWVVNGPKGGRIQNTGFDVTYNSIVDWGLENGLKISFISCHDGMGLKSWFELKVTPDDRTV